MKRIKESHVCKYRERIDDARGLLNGILDYFSGNWADEKEVVKHQVQSALHKLRP